MRIGLLAAALGVVFSGLTHADLRAARAEPNLEKRSKLALGNALALYTNARQAYQQGDTNQVKADATEIQESVELAYTSLEDTGKDPRKSPKWFKQAEIETRDLLRKIDGFQQEMDFNDRPVLDAVKAKVQQVHDSLLLQLMEGKKHK